MKASVRQVGHVSVVDLSGKITIGQGDIVLREKVYELLRNGQRHILLNLKKVSYMDSAGIGELAACYKRAREENCTIKLLHSRGKVTDLLQMIKLEEMIETFRDENEAFVSFSRREQAVVTKYARADCADLATPASTHQEQHQAVRWQVDDHGIQNHT